MQAGSCFDACAVELESIEEVLSPLVSEPSFAHPPASSAAKTTAVDPERAFIAEDSKVEAVGSERPR